MLKKIPKIISPGLLFTLDTNARSVHLMAKMPRESALYANINLKKDAVK